MHEWQSLSHVRWDCKYHVVIMPKFRRKVFDGKLRKQIGVILRELCRQRGVELLEGHCMADHIHMCLSSSAQIQCGEHDWFPEREECRANPPRIAPRATHDGFAFLGSRVLRKHCGAGPRSDSPVHP